MQVLIALLKLCNGLTTMEKAIVWKVTKLRASGKGRFNVVKFELNIIFTLLITKSAYLKKPRYKILKIIEMTSIFFL